MRYHMTKVGNVYVTDPAAGVPTDCQPVVVIAYENREQVERFAKALIGFDFPLAAEQVQRALCSLVTPPRPEEPTGLGAVVEDASQVEFIHLGSGLWAYGTTDGPSAGFSYADLAVVRVLSGGVTDV